MTPIKDSAYWAVLVHSSPDAMITEDMEGLITSWNPAAERVFGYSAAEAIGHSSRLLIPDDRAGEQRALLERIGRGERVERLHVTRRTKDGACFETVLTVSPVQDADRRIIGAATIVRTPHAPLMRGPAIDEHQAMFTAILASAMDAVVSVDEDQHIVFFNEAAERMFRCTAQEAQGSALDRFIPPRFREQHGQHIRTFGESGITNRMMGRLGTITGIRADGEEFPIEASISHVGTNDTSLYTVILRDVTERQRAEAALRESRERLRAIVETAVDGVITIDERGTIESINPAVERIFQYAQEELIGHNVKMLMPEPDHRQHDGYLDRYRDTGEKKIIGIGREVQGRRKDGSVFPIELSISETRLPGLRFFTGILRDISQRKQAEEALRLMTVELDQRVATRTQELVRSQARLRALATELSLAEQRVRRQIATELHDYLGQLLVVARLKLGQTLRVVEDPGLSNQLKEADNALESAISYSRSMVAELTPPVLREFGFTMALTWLAQQMQRHHLRVELRLNNISLDLTEDESVLIFLSVRELLMNIVKHARTDRAAVSVTVTPDGERKIAVTDQGRGFDVETAQVEHHGKLDHFGLFSIHERMEALGGRFIITSGQNQGTCATLLLPGAVTADAAAGVEAKGPARPAKNGAKSGGVLRVLMVDDHVMVRQGLKGILELYDDLQVIGEAADGEEAVTLATTHRPDVVVMDINMPKLDGVEATRRIKERFPATVVIGLSVQHADHIERVMKDAGASCYLTKDEAGDRLYQAIRDAVQSKNNS